jgi:hypothetical protein
MTPDIEKLIERLREHQFWSRTDQGGDHYEHDPIMDEAADALASLVRERDAAREKFWLELRSPGQVPRRGGPFPVASKATVLREWMDANPDAFITVVSHGLDGAPCFDDAPETLQMLDGRSMARGRRHIETSSKAHARLSSEERQ